MTSSTQRTWVWANSGRWWKTRKPGELQSVGSQRVGHDWETEQQHVKCGSLFRSIRITGELVRDAESQGPPQTYWIRICILTRSPGDLLYRKVWGEPLQFSPGCPQSALARAWDSAGEPCVRATHYRFMATGAVIGWRKGGLSRTVSWAFWITGLKGTAGRTLDKWHKANPLPSQSVERKPAPYRRYSAFLVSYLTQFFRTESRSQDTSDLFPSFVT